MRLSLPAFCLLFVLAACMPGPPTGDVVAPPTHFLDGERLVTFSLIDNGFAGKGAHITVRGDLVYDVVLVDGREYRLSGNALRGDWLTDEGSVIAFLPPGEYDVQAYSCFESSFEWKCGCKNPDDCGHWMYRTIMIPR